MKKENRLLEYKSKLTKSYLKTVSAFANYNDGEIIFGVSDDGIETGIEDVKEVCLSIENQINDSIKPKPDYTIKINENNTITLLIKKGFATPYLYNGNAYKRNDTSTIEVGDLELKRLVLEGMNLNFEELPSSRNDLTFSYLSDILVRKLNLSEFNTDTLKNLNLYSDKHRYNNAAELLADSNTFPGLDIVVYGDSINEFKQCLTLSGMSLLEQFFMAIDLFKSLYVVEKIENGNRQVVEKIPLNAFREAIANSLIHRTWDIKANNKIEMYEDKIVVSSPGGLLEGITEEQYKKGAFSILRNPIIANVFYRVGIIEMFATGVKRINDSYKEMFEKPIFDIMNDSIMIELPMVNSIKLTSNEHKIISSMDKNVMYSRVELEAKTNLGKDTLIRNLNSLIDKNLISKDGKAKATYYYKN